MRSAQNTILAKRISWNCVGSFVYHESIRSNARGQTLVEFTLIFVLLLVIAWIPADFGLAFYTGQLGLNASREGARIAAADPNVTTAFCAMPGCLSEPDNSVLRKTAERISAALLPGAAIDVTLDPPGAAGCNRMVTVSVNGSYNSFFYRILNLLGASITATIPIQRSTRMRWEHQHGCAPS
jgi:hypothetical protein